MEVSDEVLVSGSFADVKSGRYENRAVAVKVLRVPSGNEMEKTWNVSGSLSFGVGSESFVPEALQGGCPLEFIVASKRLEAPRRLWGCQFPLFFHRHRSDGI